MTFSASDLPLFAGVNPKVTARLNEDLIRHFIDGDVILKQGQTAKDVFLILRGSVRIEKNGVFLAKREANEIVGEQALIDDAARSADVIAQGAVEGLLLPEALVRELLANQKFAMNITRAISAKLRESTEERARRYRIGELLFAEFRAHLAPQLLEELLRRGENFGAPRNIQAVILFADIRSFTQRSATVDPMKLAQELGAYFNEIVKLIHESGGLVDKFIGDAVMAIWGYAGWDATFPSKVVSASAQMVRLGKGLTIGGAPVEIGVGVNCGQVFVGNIGSEVKRQFTVLGPPVNIASRIQDACKTLEKSILIGPDLYALLPEDLQARCVSHENQPIRGSDPLTLHSFDPEVSS